MQFTHVLLLFLSWWAATSLAVTKSNVSSLLSVDIEVNGALHHVAKDQFLQLVWGDRIKVLDAHVQGMEKVVEIVNLVGYRARSSSLDDRGVELQSHRDLNKEWSHDGRGQLFRVNVRNSDQFFGRVYLNFHKPRLESVDFQINGKVSRFLPGGEIRLRETDRLKLEDLSANFSYQEGEVSYQVEATEDPNKLRLILYRHDMAFASLHLLIVPP